MHITHLAQPLNLRGRYEIEVEIVGVGFKADFEKAGAGPETEVLNEGRRTPAERRVLLFSTGGIDHVETKQPFQGHAFDQFDNRLVFDTGSKKPINFV